MKNILLLTLVVIGLSVSACQEDEKEGTLVLHFKAVYDDQTLQTFETLPFNIGQQLQFTHLSMLIADLQLFHQASGAVYVLDEIEEVNLSFDEMNPAAIGYEIRIRNIPPSTYDGLRFGIGVPPDVNQKKPADFLSGNPLSHSGNYWVAWDSYIFMKTEGRLDTLGDGSLDLGFAMHTGSDALYRTIEWLLPLEILDGKETKLDVLLDYSKLLEGVDIKSKPQNHSPGDTLQIQQMVNNLVTSLKLVK